MDDNAPSLITLADDAKVWMQNAALPFWFDRGIDRQRGGFIEQLTVDCEPINDPTRPVRVAARQIYVFALAAHRGWFSDGRAVALDGAEYLIDKGLGAGDQPGFPHSLMPDGSVADPTRDAYDHAFILLALAWAWRVTEEPRIKDAIDQVLSFCDECLADPKHGGWIESRPAVLPRRQNPQMHALEAMLALHDVFGGTAYLNRASGFVSLFDTKLLTVGQGSLLEFFDDTWSAPAQAVAPSVEPGHYFEWSWLLATYADRKNQSVHPAGPLLRQWAWENGMNEIGCAYDQCAPDGRITLSTSRLWPQTECVKAHLAYAALGDSQAVEAAGATLHNVMQRYINPAPQGAWFDRLDKLGNVIDNRLVARTFYHIACMIDEAVRVADLVESQQ